MGANRTRLRGTHQSPRFPYTPAVPAAPTALAATDILADGFTANWSDITDATKYYLDASTSGTFLTFLTGYQNKDVGDVNTLTIGSLDPATDYYYRVRSSNINGISVSSNTISCTTSVGDEVVIGTQTWKTANVADNILGSKVYNNDEANRTLYGGLYNWGMIPSIEALYPGWHVPSDAEFLTLHEFLNPTVGGKLKETGTTYWDSPNTGATNSSHFYARGGGLFSGFSFSQLKRFAMWWTTDEVGANAKWHGVTYNDAESYAGSRSKADFISVRLIKD